VVSLEWGTPLAGESDVDQRHGERSAEEQQEEPEEGPAELHVLALKLWIHGLEEHGVEGGRDEEQGEVRERVVEQEHRAAAAGCPSELDREGEEETA
jgi:hypothetical protein